MEKVGIIGGSGFIGSYITKQFLDNGYEVKVATTDITKEEKYKHLMNLKNADHLYIEELNVEDKAQLKEFVNECDIVIHSGTPFQLTVTDPEKELFTPTIKGTENFLDVIKETPSVKKVVLIASVAVWNTNFPLPADGKSFTDTYDENDQKFTSESSHPYAQAKFIANQVVEQFINNNPSLPFEISSVSPVMVMGKSMSDRLDSTSTGMQFLIKNKIAPDEFIQAMYDHDVPFAIVDVNDVALATFKVATTNKLHGKNYLLSSETYKVSDVHEMLNDRMPKSVAEIIYKNDLAKKDLNISFRPVLQTLSQ